MATDGRDSSKYSFKDKSFSELTEEEKFILYGTNNPRLEELSSLLDVARKTSPQRVFAKVMGEAKQAEASAGKVREVSIENSKRAKEIAMKLISGESLSELDKRFIAVHGDEVDKAINEV